MNKAFVTHTKIKIQRNNHNHQYCGVMAVLSYNRPLPDNLRFTYVCETLLLTNIYLYVTTEMVPGYIFLTFKIYETVF